MEKYYNIMITGKVQDIGFRVLVEDIARLYDLRGFAFNDVDGSLKIVCYGENGAITEFLEEIKEKGAQKGAVIAEVLKDEITSPVYLPPRFARLYTDELVDISRKLDVGIELLSDIRNGINSLNTKFDSLDTKLGSLDTKLGSLNTKFDSLDTKLGSLDTKLGSLNTKFDSLDTKLGSLDTKLGSLNTKFDSLDTKLGSFIDEQRDYNQWMKEHNQLLEKILEKLAKK